MPTLYLPQENRDNLEWFRDKDGVWTTSKHVDDVTPFSFDYTDYLPSGVTVTTSTWQNANGVTSSSPALATPVATVTITGTDGSIENKLVLSSGETKIYLYRFVGVPLGRSRTDYGQ
jgi:hypothetical protein